MINPVTWEEYKNDKLRADTIKDLLRMAWYDKNKSEWPVFNLTKIVYGW